MSDQKKKQVQPTSADSGGGNQPPGTFPPKKLTFLSVLFLPDDMFVYLGLFLFPAIYLTTDCTTTNDCIVMMMMLTLYFADDMAEKTQKAITIHEIDPDAMKQLIDYAYAGDILITEENVQASWFPPFFIHL